MKDEMTAITPTAGIVAVVTLEPDGRSRKFRIFRAAGGERMPTCFTVEREELDSMGARRWVKASDSEAIAVTLAAFCHAPIIGESISCSASYAHAAVHASIWPLPLVELALPDCASAP